MIALMRIALLVEALTLLATLVLPAPPVGLLMTLLFIAVAAILLVAVLAALSDH